jgi:hypothetical protein
VKDPTEPQVRAVYRFVDLDYKFGLDTLLCRVTRVVEPDVTGTGRESVRVDCPGVGNGLRRRGR